MYTNICTLCHQEFQSKSPRAKYCSRQHYRNCKQCGKQFALNDPFKSIYCSTACSAAARPYKYECVCRICGKHFKGRSKNSDVCQRPHPSTCCICGKDIIIKQVKTGRNKYTCNSRECRYKFRQQNALEKYGVTDVKRTPEQRKIASENRKRAVEQQQKKKKELDQKLTNNNEQYNDESSVSRKDITTSNIISSNKDRQQDKQIHYDEPALEHLRQSMRKKYGVDNASQLASVKEKKRQAYLKKYGVDNPMKSKEVQEKRRKKHIEKYGTPAYDKVIMNAFKTNNKKLRYEWDHLNETILSWQDKPTLLEVANYFNVSTPVISDKIQQGKLDEKLLQRQISKYESKMEKFLESHFSHIVYKKHDRTVISPYELDFYFPDNQLAIELSPTKTHNIKESFGKESRIDKNYHKRKFILCAQLGIELITIFDWHDWDKVEEMITQKLSKTSNKIYARKTQYNEMNIINKDIFQALSDWHILSMPKTFKRKNDVSILNYNNQIVGIALWTKTKSLNTIELKRMVFKPEYSVAGGASKLLKNYIKNHPQYTKIITYSDCNLGTGSVYQKIGFTQIVQSSPSLMFYNPAYDMSIKETSLVAIGADRLLRYFPGYIPVGIGDDKPTNEEIVMQYGFLPVYDCGYRKWEYITPNP